MTSQRSILLTEFFLWFALFNLLDIGTTAVFLLVDPTLEANPIASWLYSSMGLAGLALGKTMSMAIVLAVLWKSKYFHQLIAIAMAIMSFVVFNNIYLLYDLLGVV